jgi:thermitase
LLILASLAIGLLWAFSFRSVSAASSSQSTPTQSTPTSTILVHFAKSSSAEERAALIAEIGGEPVTWMPQIGVAEVRLPAGTSSSVATASAAALPVAANGLVTYAEVDGTVSATYSPDDPDFNDATMSYGLRQIDALDAWDVVTGSQQIVIAVIDSGINADHPEFVGRLVPGYDFMDKDAQPEDASGHGTHVAGIIAAALDNGQGVAGVCPNCRLMPIKVLDKYNMGSWSLLAQGILFAADHGARVINISVGAVIPSQTVESAISYAIESGAVIVAAAGNNDSNDPFYPAAYDGVVAVGATTRSGKLWAKSDYGSYIDLVAPGDVIYSTFNNLHNIYHGYTYMSGTSMAAPFVSGVAGLLLSVAPKLSATDVTEALILGAEDLGRRGKDSQFGYGRVNAMKSLRAPIEGLVQAVGEISQPKQYIFLPALNAH